MNVGDRIEFIVPHCDPSVNLYDRIFGVARRRSGMRVADRRARNEPVRRRSRTIAAMSLPTDEFYRISKLPPYVFAVINEMKATARAEQQDVVDLGMGNPDGATPRPIVNKLIEAARNARNHRYSMSKGIPQSARGDRQALSARITASSSIRRPKRSSPSAPRTRWRICCSRSSDRATRWCRRIRRIRFISTA